MPGAKVVLSVMLWLLYVLSRLCTCSRVPFLAILCKAESRVKLACELIIVGSSMLWLSRHLAVRCVSRMLLGAMRLVPQRAKCVFMYISGQLIDKLLGARLLTLDSDRTTLLETAEPKPCSSEAILRDAFLVHAAMHMEQLQTCVVLTIWPVSLVRQGVARYGMVSATKLAWLWPRPCVDMPMWQLS